jgi:predicted nucleic-acid-binding protein
VLVEALWVLDAVHGLTHAQQGTVVAMLLEHDQFALQQPEVVQAALDRFTRRPSLGFSDCLVLESARKAGHLPLGTFDRKLARTEGATLVPRA